jgi:MYXO-CTERM domain-containing protein
VKARKHEAEKAPRPAGWTTACAFGVCALSAFALGCGPEDWQPSGVGPGGDAETQALLDPMAGASMNGDLRGMPAPPAAPAGVERVQGALSGNGDGNGKGEPAVFYLDYATGEDLPATDYDACDGTPPKFNCTFAPTLRECQRQIQAYLDKWYADMNIVFTLTRPTSGKFYTEVISSGGGAWCNVEPKVAGVAPFLCKDLDGGVAYTFLGGQSAKQTAVIIAQEQAHLVGLEHVTSPTDIMYPSICSDCDGFQDKDLPIDGDRCDRGTQNSYQMLKDRLGAWKGGPKPSAFGCANDTVPPTVKILDPAADATVGKNFALRVDAKDDCELTEVQVQVAPQGLKATSYAPPFEWDLANISGHQTITVTAIDGFGHVTTETVSITAPMDKGTLDATTPNVAGCAVATGAAGLAGALPALGVLALFSRRRRAPEPRRRRRRAVTGALEENA